MLVLWLKKSSTTLPVEGKTQKQGAYISAMVSGRLAGMAVRPFPLQSTMLLLQVQDSGHCNTLQEEDDDDW